MFGFGTFLTVVVTAMQAYVFLRAASVPWIKRHVTWKGLVPAGAGMWVVFVVGRGLGRGGGGAASSVVELVGMDWLGAMLLMCAAMLAVDVATCFGLLWRRRAPTLRGYALAGGAVLVGIAIVQGMRPPVVDDYDVQLPGLPKELDGTVVVAIADTHLGSLIGPRWMAARVEQIQAIHPDMILLLGDITEGHGESTERLLPIMRRLSAPMGVWGVLGNHEHYGRRAGGRGLMDEAGVRVLRDEWAEARPGLIVAGVDNLGRRPRPGRDSQAVAKALSGRPAGATIYLSHIPRCAGQAAGEGAGLMLCGHTHGGQIWPFDYVIRTRQPLLEGRYEVDGMPVIVSRGAGTWGPRMRLWAPGEIVRIALHAKPAPATGPAATTSRTDRSSRTMN